MPNYKLQMGPVDISFTADTAPHALASATAIAQALQRSVVLEQWGDATTRQTIAAPAAGNPTNVGLGITY